MSHTLEGTATSGPGPRKKTSVVFVAVGVLAVLVVAVMASRCTTPPESMTAEDTAAIAAIAEKDRAAVETVAAKVAAWNKSKDESVATFSDRLTKEVAELGGAIERGDWPALKSRLSAHVAAVIEAQGAAHSMRAVGDIALTWDPLVVPDMEMPTHVPYITWDEWEPSEEPYAQYAASYEPIFTGSDGIPSSADTFAPEPWSPPESIDAHGVVLANNEPFRLAIRLHAAELGLALQDLLSVSGLIDKESPILNNSSAPMAEKYAAARTYLTKRLTAWNQAKDAALSAYNASIRSQINPAKVAIIETAFETGDSDTLRAFLEPDFAERLTDVDWHKRLQELLGDQLRDPGIKLMYAPLEVEDIEIPQSDPPPTIEEWCEAQDCVSYPYSRYVKEYEPMFGTDTEAVGVAAEQYPIPERWAPPGAPMTVTLVNPEGWLELRIPVLFSMVR